MNEATIKRERTQSILKELIPAALSTLNDVELASLCVTDVRCSKGRHDAEIFLDKMMFDEREQNSILKRLKKVSTHLQRECASSEGWYKSPNFHFKFDDQLEKQNHIDSLFKKIQEDLKKGQNG